MASILHLNDWKGDAGAAKEVFVRAAGPLTHIPQAIFWAIISVFVWRAVTGEWSGTGEDRFDGGSDFVYVIVIAAMWVRLSLPSTQPHAHAVLPRLVTRQ